MSAPYSEEGYKLMGAAFEVYNEIGYGIAEEVYQECLLTAAMTEHLSALIFANPKPWEIRKLFLQQPAQSRAVRSCGCFKYRFR